MFTYLLWMAAAVAANYLRYLVKMGKQVTYINDLKLLIEYLITGGVTLQFPYPRSS